MQTGARTARRPDGGCGTATVLVVIATCLAALDAVIVRALAGQVHPLLIAFFRAFFGLAVMLPWILTRVDLGASPYRWLHALRAALKQASLVAAFVAFTHMQLADATVILFTAPLFLTVGACLFLSETVAPLRWLGVAVGFFGILIIVRPRAAGFDPWIFAALASAVLTAVIQLVLRGMTQTDTTPRLVAWNLLTMAPIGLLIALPVWVTPTPDQLALLALQGVLGVLNMTLMTCAFGLAEASIVAPLDYLRLPIVAGLAFFFFDQTPAFSTWIGAAIIASAIVLANGDILRKIRFR